MTKAVRRRGADASQAHSGAESNASKVTKPPKKAKPRRGSTLLLIISLAIAGTGALACLTYSLIQGIGNSPKNDEPGYLVPFPHPKVTDLPMFQGDYKEEMLWGTYRPHLYLGVRARVPKSLLAGLMWIAPKPDAFEIRHTCQQHDKVLKTYGWLRHDGRSYGRQSILDGPFDITTFFVKSKGEGSGYGGDWSVRVNVNKNKLFNPPQGQEQPSAFSFFFYIGDEAGSTLNVMPNWIRQMNPEKVSDSKVGLVASGHAEPFGNWELHFRLNRTGPKHVGWEGMRVSSFHNLSDEVRNSLARNYQRQQGLFLPKQYQSDSNVAIIQVTLNPPAEAEFIFVTSPVDSEDQQLSRAIRTDSLSGGKMDERIVDAESAFDERFETVFPSLAEIPDGKTTQNVAKAALSNMLGGMGYFYGQSRIAIPKHLKKPESGEKFWLYWPAPLFTAVPSRSFFPRGFLWDEGFHQLIIRKWDAMVSMDAIAHWLDMLNSEGWIPREQILGEEARSFVPDEFVQQHLDNGNPPTLFLPLQALAEQALNSQKDKTGSENDKTGEATPGMPDPEVVASFLERSLPRLQRWFRWFNTTQQGQLPGSYYWHGRDPDSVRELNPKTLQSGLDDYPRASHPGVEERHVDLRCWLALASSLLSNIRKTLGVSDKMNQVYADTQRMLNDVSMLHSLHWDDSTQSFADFGNHTENVQLIRREFVDQQSGVFRSFLEREVLTPPTPGFVPQFGYVSLFPLLLKLLPPNSPSLGKILGQLEEGELLWTNFGLRSLAVNSSLYMKRNTEHDPPYWRGPIWININFLAVASLHHYSKQEGPYQDTALRLYKKLRKALIRNIVKQYNRSGYLWEQYEPNLGKGKGSHPFTGWTALIVLIIYEQYN